MPNIRIKNNAPNITAKNLVPHPRIKSGGSVSVVTQGGSSVVFAGKGYLVGMMALTYITTQTSGSTVQVIQVSDFKPSIRIKND